MKSIQNIIEREYSIRVKIIYVAYLSSTSKDTLHTPANSNLSQILRN